MTVLKSKDEMESFNQDLLAPCWLVDCTFVSLSRQQPEDCRARILSWMLLERLFGSVWLGDGFMLMVDV